MERIGKGFVARNADAGDVVPSFVRVQGGWRRALNGRAERRGRAIRAERDHELSLLAEQVIADGADELPGESPPKPGGIVAIGG
jgi:hypothetical protein